LSALTRIAAQEHPQVKLKSGDTVILSATPIPGNEELVSRTINNCYKHGARVFYSARNRVHASGHASREELKLMLNLVRPKFFMPVHGEFRHLALHSEIAQDVGIPKDNVIVIDDGNTINKPGRGNPEWQVLKNSIRDSLSRFLYEQMRRRPMIIPIVVEV